MLEWISIRNYVLIDSLDLELSEGFSTLTGETGSGKSILLSSLSLALGGKVEKSAIRNGEKECSVSLLFSAVPDSVTSYLEEHGIKSESDGELIIRRILKENGRSQSFLNGESVSARELEEIGSYLLDISSQHSYQKLLSKKKELEMLDSSGGLNELKNSVRKEYSTYSDLIRRRDELISERKKGEEDREYNEYLLKELESANLKIGEDEELEEKLHLYSSSEYIVENLNASLSSLSSASSCLSDGLSFMQKARKKDESLDEYLDRLESVSIELEDISSSLGSRLSSFDFDPYEIEKMNERLALLQRIRKRHGGSIENAIKRRNELILILEDGQAFDEKIEKLEKEIAGAKTKLENLSEKLTDKRKKWAKELSGRTSGYLRRLGMNDALFLISIKEKDLSPDGKDDIEFLLRANKGEKMLSLDKAASGGELSRIMLSIKMAFSDSDDVPTIIFDEIDAGIGGETANQVAMLVKELSEKRQVISITHLAQIASKADVQFKVEKREEKGRTISFVHKLDKEERIHEIARLLSGNESELSLSHASSLLEVQL